VAADSTLLPLPLLRGRAGEGVFSFTSITEPMAPESRSPVVTRLMPLFALLLLAACAPAAPREPGGAEAPRVTVGGYVGGAWGVARP